MSVRNASWSLALALAVGACGGPAPGSDAGRGDGGQPGDDCVSGCLVGGTCFPDGVVNPTNPCEICDAALAPMAFSPNDGGTCDDGMFCTIDDRCAAGACAGAPRECDDAIACNGVATCNEAMSACVAGTTSCTAGEVCDATSGSCVGSCPGCSIDGTCYGEGQLDASNPCHVCRVASSRTDWSPNDGASCDDALFCTTGDVCASGVCTGGAARACDDGVACNGSESCSEDTDACAAGTSSCSASEVCDVASDACVATCTGCVIGGECYGDGQRNPANQCEVCAAATSRTGWTPNDGATCDDGLFCTDADVCTGTSCGGAARDCSDGVACTGIETCDESADRCAAGTTTCTGGQLCDTSMDACVLSCAGGTTRCGTSCTNTSFDPANCGTCGTTCATGQACAAGSCVLLTAPLTVTLAGSGSGSVTSAPAGIDCGSDCREDYIFGTTVVLTATAAGGSTFTGWLGGGCSGAGTCTTTLMAATTIMATFDSMPLGTCDSFSVANSTTIPGWTERAGDWFIDAQRLRNSTTGSVYTNVITRDASTQTDGCGRLTAIHNGTIGSVQSVGVVLRWTAPNNYVVALVQDNTSAGNFNSVWIYQYPGGSQLASDTAVSFGTSPNLEACVSGSAVTLRVDAARDGTYEYSLPATTAIAGAGLTGAMTHTFTYHPFVDDFCWGP